MVNKHFKLESLRLYEISGFEGSTVASQILRQLGARNLSVKNGSIVYAAPHSLQVELVAEFERRNCDSLKAAVERLAALPDPAPAAPTSTIVWRSIESDPPTGETRMVFYASERDGTILQGLSDQIAVGRYWWAEKPRGPVGSGKTIGEVLDDVERGDAEVVSVKLSGQASGAVQVSDMEFGWVIEHGDSKPSWPLYFRGCKMNGYFAGAWTPVLSWSYDDACALRFSRRVDAEAMLPLFAETHRVAEHGWDTRPAEAAKPV